MNRKRLIVVDTNNSALARSAYSRFESEEFHIIPALNYKTLTELFHHLISLQPSTIHFAWREVLHNLLVTQKKSELELLFSGSQVGFSVADYLGLSEKMRMVDSYLIRSSDYFTVVNEDLSHQYFDTFNLSQIPFVFHDSPDVECLKTIPAVDENRTLDFIWVGNSKWGKNYGIHDYKGFEEFIRPLVTVTESEKQGFAFEIVDSAHKQLSNFDTLMAISRSKCLILSSKQEGTGLPALEALALGTLPVCRQVGVLPELLKLEPNLPIFESIEELREILSRNSHFPVLSPNQNRMLFDRYMESIGLEKLPEPHIKNTNRILRNFGLYPKLRAKLLWQLRRIKRY